MRNRSALGVTQIGIHVAAHVIVPIDRRMHDSDVMERVLGVETIDDSDDVHTEVVDVGARPWLAGVTLSAVQVTVGDTAPRRRRKNFRKALR